MKLCDLEISCALQELGYSGEYKEVAYADKNLKHKIPCPRLDDAAYFLRDKYGYVICVYPYYESEVEDEPYQYEIQYYDRNDEYWRFVCQRKCDMTYDDALNEAVKAVIQILKQVKL